MKKLTKLLFVFIVFSFVFFLGACSFNGKELKPITAQKLSYEHSPKSNVDTISLKKEEYINAYYSFVDKLYPYEDENVVFSPLSAYIALSMLSNGAKNSSLSDLEDLLGLSLSDMNVYASNLFSYYNETNHDLISSADSFWVNNSRSDYSVKDSFLKSIKDLYATEVYSSPFDDSTLKDINNWVYNKTDGMIEETIDDIPKDAIFYLLNTVLFDGKWIESPQESSLTFTNLDSSTSSTNMIFGTVANYYESSVASGFMKEYQSTKGKYAFFGILPNDFEEFMSGDIGENIKDLLSSRKFSLNKIRCFYKIPEFDIEYKLQIKEIMVNLGYTNIYSDKMADFTNMFDFEDGNICISRCFQKARIILDKDGTKAAAVTVIEGMKTTSVGPEEYEDYYVYLDKPFIYCIFDLENNIPVFIGSITNL